jgi:hypothetical protein
MLMAGKFALAVLALALLFCILTALSASFDPEGFADRLGLKVANAGGVNEIRAQYAGFFLAVAAVCAAALGGVLPRETAFVLLAVVFGGLIVGRLASLALNGGVAGYGPTIRALYAIDAVGFALAIAAIAVARAGSA